MVDPIRDFSLYLHLFGGKVYNNLAGLFCLGLVGVYELLLLAFLL